MDNRRIYDLKNRKRLLNFPFRLNSIGWMPHHICFHRHAVIRDFFVCISSDRPDPVERIVNGVLRSSPPHTTPSIGFVLPGTRIHTIRASTHDELFFSYPASVLPRFREMFGELHNFTFSWLPHERILELRRELKLLDEPGTADRLDQLALRLISEIILHRNESLRDENALALRIHSIAASLLRGRSLRSVLNSYGMSERSFYRAWREIFSVSPRQYLLKHREDEARRLLCETDLPLSEIARRCGYSSLSYFHQAFRKSLGMTPGRYRARNRTHLFSPPDDEQVSDQNSLR